MKSKSSTSSCLYSSCYLAFLIIPALKICTCLYALRLDAPSSFRVAGSCCKPLAAPRFDTFAESIVGSWKYIHPNNDEITVSDVEEVMRSCGGAVQGIREIPLSNELRCSNGDYRTYHNRADDGFVYFDCGSYT